MLFRNIWSSTQSFSSRSHHRNHAPYTQGHVYILAPATGLRAAPEPPQVRRRVRMPSHGWRQRMWELCTWGPIPPSGPFPGPGPEAARDRIKDITSSPSTTLIPTAPTCVPLTRWPKQAVLRSDRLGSQEQQRRQQWLGPVGSKVGWDRVTTTCPSDLV